jgi:hypothetical protein
MVKQTELNSCSVQDKRDLGLIDCRYINYDLISSENADNREFLYLTIYMFTDVQHLNKYLSTINKNNPKFYLQDILLPTVTHHFLIGDKTLVKFRLDNFPLGAKHDEYRILLNRYRNRQGARLLIPPDVDFDDQSYFDEWAAWKGFN